MRALFPLTLRLTFATLLCAAPACGGPELEPEAENADQAVLGLPPPSSPRAPTITQLSATRGSVGDTLVVTGTNFTNYSPASGVATQFVFEARVGGVAAPTASFRVVSATRIELTVPAGAISGPVALRWRNTLNNTVGTVLSTAQFRRVPRAPSGLVGEALSSQSIELRWTDRATDEVSYQVWRRTLVGASTLLATLSTNSVRFRDVSCQANTAYTYRVVAVAADGAESDPAEVQVVSQSVRAPTLSASVTHQTEVLLRWVDNSSDEAGFQVFQSVGGGPLVSLGTLPPNQTSEPITGLTPGTRLTYVVRALNPGLINGSDSNAVTVTTWAAPVVGVGLFPDTPTFLAEGAHVATGAFAIFDTNGDGLVAGANGNTDPFALYPAWQEFRVGTPVCGIFGGARFAPGANVIVLVELNTFGLLHPGQSQFVAVHLRVAGGVITPVAIVAGDLSNTNTGGAGGIYTGDSVVEFNLTMTLPSAGQTGAVRGGLIMSTASPSCLGRAAGAFISLDLDGVILRDE